MELLKSSDNLKRYRRTAWEFQQTFATPLKDLRRFTGQIFSAIPDVNHAHATIEKNVFEPRYGLLTLLAKHSLEPNAIVSGCTIEAANRDEARDLLAALLSEWTDFLFVPNSKQFVMYADHDEYITFFAHRKSNLGRLVEALTSAKFQAVDYTRKVN